MGGQSQCLHGYLPGYSVHLIEDPARLHDRYPGLDRPLSLTHPRFSRFFSDGLVREYTDPYPAAALDMPGDRDTRLLFARKYLTFVYPDLYPDLAIRCLCLCESVINICPQGVQRHPPLLIPLGPCDLGPGKTPGTPDLNPLGPESLRRSNTLFHGPPEGDPLLQLKRNIFSHKLGLYLRFLNLQNVDIRSEE